MRIHTFHDNIGRDQSALPLVYFWKERWERQGWEAVILGRDDAQKHPQWAGLATAYDRLPTVNGKPYEFACYVRWLAMEMAGGGWMTDSDVIPYGFQPRAPTERLTLWNGGACPCMVSGSAAEYGRLARRFAAWQPTVKDMNFAHGPHCSDQNICDQIPGEYDVERAVVQYLDPGWQKAEAVHYAGCVMSEKRPKFSWIPRLR
jgi:hypothetical protein